MEIPTLDEALVRLTQVLPFGIELILALMALGGIILVGSGLYGVYSQISDRGRGQMYGRNSTPWTGLGQILLGGALTVPLVIMWDVAGTFVVGGNATYNILSYLPPDTSQPWCEKITSGLVLFFMILGLIAVGWSAVIMNERMLVGYQQGSTIKAITFFVGGLACFFILDVANIIANTIGLEVGFDQVCAVLGP